MSDVLSEKGQVKSDKGQPKITEIGSAREAPDAPRDFDHEGSFESLVRVCRKDYASNPEWDYVVYHYGDGLWNVWQVERGRGA
jgi:hypothetical protein